MSALPLNALKNKNYHTSQGEHNDHDHGHDREYLDADNIHELDHKEQLEATLQEFAMQVGIICALENGNKIPPKEAYHQIKALFKDLKVAKRAAYPKCKQSISNT